MARSLTLREAAGAAVRVMAEGLQPEPPADWWNRLANARYLLADALARYDEAHAIAMLHALREGEHNEEAAGAGPQEVEP